MENSTSGQNIGEGGEVNIEINKADKNPENTGIIRNEKGQFVPGVSGNPEGKPKGSISVISLVKQILSEKAKTSSGEERERLETLARNIVHLAINKQDKDMIKLIVNYLDGMPKQTLGFDQDDIVTKLTIEFKDPDGIKDHAN